MNSNNTIAQVPNKKGTRSASGGRRGGSGARDLFTCRDRAPKTSEQTEHRHLPKLMVAELRNKLYTTESAGRRAPPAHGAIRKLEVLACTQIEVVELLSELR
ncbi:hypothetical protein EVAR_52601_1 [Eumeta japonica]|uniref:Uncharacterized protein n=1 Tax=Eumeta variegata TaxID=151549 RepID=A0A4C1YPT7_EUMVA|nr:hypothetical protein EVAR_52601_1 [Eumeta japonica]